MNIVDFVTFNRLIEAQKILLVECNFNAPVYISKLFSFICGSPVKTHVLYGFQELHLLPSQLPIEACFREKGHPKLPPVKNINQLNQLLVEHYCMCYRIYLIKPGQALTFAVLRNYNQLLLNY